MLAWIFQKKRCVWQRKNAEKLKINAEFLESDLFENVKGTYDVIVSNPPYIRTSVIETLQEEVKRP